jgi:dTDP-glucose 4,6-dehydratase
LGVTDFVQTNIVGVQVLLDAIKDSGRKVRFLQVSTDEVYGSIDSGSWTEEWPLQPNSPYSASKASSELLARSYNRTHGMDVVITRCSNNFGPKQDPEKLIPNFILKLSRDEKIPVYGDGLNIRDWLFVKDHCDGIYLVLTKGLSGEIYNIGGGTELTNIEISKELLKLLNKDESYITYVTDRLGHDRRYSVNSAKIESIGYKANKNFLANLRLTKDWFLNEYV